MDRTDVLDLEEFQRALDAFISGSFPLGWKPAEDRLLRSQRAALTLLAPTMEDALLPDREYEAEQLLKEALPHLPDELAAQVRQFLED